MKTLLTTTALLALLAGGAHAGDFIHKEMLGGWCATGHSESEGWSHHTYVRSTRRACGEGDWLHLRARGYVEQVGEPITCRFVTIKQTDRSTFAVTARCRALEEAGPYIEQMEFAGEAGDKLTGSVKIANHSPAVDAANTRTPDHDHAHHHQGPRSPHRPR